MKEIFERTSIRQYTDQEISKADMEQILKAGMAAPSARNAQPWEFIVVRNKKTLEKMSRVSEYSGMLAEANVGIVVLGNTDKAPLGYCVEDCAAATENMLLEAESLGIGACWIGGWPRTERTEILRKMFELPEQIEPLWMVSFGWPKQKPQPKDKWKEGNVHYERY